jgi:hypothetical protein
MLNRANRRAQHTQYKRAIAHPTPPQCSRLQKYITSAGDTPKQITSDRESISAPKRDVPLMARATRPSRLSNRPANKMARAAIRQSPAMANRMAVTPEHRAKTVNTVGANTRTGMTVGNCGNRLFLDSIGSRPNAAPHSLVHRRSPFRQQ